MDYEATETHQTFASAVQQLFHGLSREKNKEVINEGGKVFILLAKGHQRFIFSFLLFKLVF